MPRSRLFLAVALLVVAACTRAPERPPVPTTADEDTPDPPAVVPSTSAADPPILFSDDGRIRSLPANAPAKRYITLHRDACEAELGRRKIAYTRAAPTPGVLAPVRLGGPLSGVTIHSTVHAAQRAKSKYEIFDCRLVLALDDFAQLLAKSGIVDVVHFAAYRPKSENGCTAKYAGMQHCAALALDIGLFTRADKSVLSVEKDFHGKIGDPTCRPDAGPRDKTPNALVLWSLVCDATNKGLFNVILTPNYNAQHGNHFHVEITPDADWQMVR